MLVRRLSLVITVLLLSPRLAPAACDPTTEPDRSDIARARAAVAAHCDCAAATSHGDYVTCAAHQANTTLANKSCRGQVKRCAAKSTCGKPGFVTCCETSNERVTKGRTKSDATECTAPKDGTACVGSYPSLCDACTPTGCASCGDGVLQTGEECDPPGPFCRGGCNPFTGLCVDLACATDCSCPDPFCGDSVIDPGEDCDPPASPCAGGGTCAAGCLCLPPS